MPATGLSEPRGSEVEPLPLQISMPGLEIGPDGRAVIDDIRHFGEYAKAFGEEGFDVKRSGSRIVSAFLAILTFGSLRPATLIATRSAPAPGR